MSKERLFLSCCSPPPSLCSVSIYTDSQESNLASQCRLNDHTFQKKTSDCPISAILLQATLWIKVRDRGSSPWQLLKPFSKDPFTELFSLKTTFGKQNSNRNKRLCSAFTNSRGCLDFLYLFSLYDVPLESNAHTFASNWTIVTGRQSLFSGILSQLMNLTTGVYFISNWNLAWQKWSQFIFFLHYQKIPYSSPSR